MCVPDMRDIQLRSLTIDNPTLQLGIGLLCYAHVTVH